MTEDGLGDAGLDQVVSREAERELDESMVEHRYAGLDRVGHRVSIFVAKQLGELCPGEKIDELPTQDRPLATRPFVPRRCPVQALAEQPASSAFVSLRPPAELFGRQTSHERTNDPPRSQSLETIDRGGLAQKPAKAPAAARDRRDMARSS